jgi:hypothetical protein
MIVDAHAVEFSKTAVPLWGGHPRRRLSRPASEDVIRANEGL